MFDKKAYQKEYNKKRYNERKEEYKERSRKYREENPEKIKQTQKRYYEETREQRLDYLKGYYENNKEEIKLRKAKWYQDNKERIKEHQNNYRKEKICKGIYNKSQVIAIHEDGTANVFKSVSECAKAYGITRYQVCVALKENSTAPSKTPNHGLVVFKYLEEEN